MGRVLGIDYGERRIGLALSDPLRIIASPYRTLERTTLEGDLAELARIIDEQEVEEVVIGLPQSVSGDMARRVEAFAQALGALRDRPLHFVDESYSSLEADSLLRQSERRRGRRREKRDRIAAQLILRSFLDR